MSDIHPGSFVGDTVEEFKKLPPWGKALVGVGVVLVIYVAYKGYTSARVGSDQATTLPPTSNASGSQSPFPMIQSGDSSVPLLPSGVNPLYNSQGGLTGYQSSAPAPSTVGATPNPPPSTTGGTTTQSGPPTTTGLLGPGLNYDQVKAKLGTLPAGDKLISGDKNRVWLVDPSGVQTLETSGYGPPVTNSGYKNGEGPTTVNNNPTNVTNHGSGGRSMHSHYTVHYGENVNEAMAKLGLNWKDIWALNGFPMFLQHGDKLRLR